MARPQGIVVVGISLAEDAPAVARAGLAVARALGRRVELVHAYTPVRHLLRVEHGGPVQASQKEVRGELEARLEAFVKNLDVDRVDVGWHVVEAPPHEGLNDIASSLGADLIVVGPGGRSGGGFGLGSTADRLLRTATRPVWIVREASAVPPHRVLVAIDLSAHAAEAYRAGQLLLDQAGADVSLELLTVLDRREIQEPLSDEQLETFARQELGRVVEIFGCHPASDAQLRVRRGDPRDEILSELESGDFDLLVMGTHGRSGLARILLGSTAAELTRRAPTSLLVIPPAAAHIAATTLDAPAVESLAHKADFAR